MARDHDDQLPVRVALFRGDIRLAAGKPPASIITISSRSLSRFPNTGERGPPLAAAAALVNETVRAACDRNPDAGPVAAMRGAGMDVDVDNVAGCDRGEWTLVVEVDEREREREEGRVCRPLAVEVADVVPNPLVYDGELA